MQDRDRFGRNSKPRRIKSNQPRPAHYPHQPSQQGCDPAPQPPLYGHPQPQGQYPQSQEWDQDIAHDPRRPGLRLPDGRRRLRPRRIGPKKVLIPAHGFRHLRMGTRCWMCGDVHEVRLISRRMGGGNASVLLFLFGGLLGAILAVSQAAQVSYIASFPMCPRCSKRRTHINVLVVVLLLVFFIGLIGVFYFHSIRSEQTANILMGVGISLELYLLATLLFLMSKEPRHIGEDGRYAIIRLPDSYVLDLLQQDGTIK